MNAEAKKPTQNDDPGGWVKSHDLAFHGVILAGHESHDGTGVEVVVGRNDIHRLSGVDVVASRRTRVGASRVVGAGGGCR